MRIIQVELPDIDDCPTCRNCGEDFGDDLRFYDNDMFIYLCRQCATAIDPLVVENAREQQ